LKRIALGSIVALAVSAPAVLAAPAVVPKTNHQPVYVHYMPWFETPQTLGGTNWGWHWTMNNRNPNVVDSTGKRQIASYYYPTIGPYASSDPDVLEYHLLLMKLSGIDGVIMDWYGPQGSNGDIPSLLNNSNAMMNRVGQFGLKAGVMLEDRYARSLNDPKANVAYLRDHYFNNPNYIRTGAGNDPLMMVFGPINYQTPSDWTQILSQAGEDVDLRTLWYESGDAGANADGEFAWIYQDANTTNHLSHQQAFLNTRSKQIGKAAGVAYPGFQDYYAAGGAGAGVGFTISPGSGSTLTQTLALNATYANNIDMVQLATWNDFGEGTMLEPTRETGFSYLKQIQQFTGTPYGEAELSAVLSLYTARKALVGEAPAQAQLTRASEALNGLDFAAANNALRLANSTAQIDRLFRQPTGTATTSTAAYDFNGDGRIVPASGAAASDSDYWVRVLNHTEYGDANLDGSVNFVDLVLLAQNYQVTSRVFGWVDASFNGDGKVDFADLVALAQNYNGNAAMTAGEVNALGGTFAADFALAMSLVPEPTTLVAAAGTATLMLRRRRRD
jgi:hypothetical protein